VKIIIHKSHLLNHGIYLPEETWQSPEQFLSQEPAQLPEQLPEQPYLQLSDLSGLQDDKIVDPKADRVRMGKAPLAAFLKNSRLDWSSSSFLLFSIYIGLKDAYELPNSA